MSVRTGRVPDFFIVGHQKCGTSALHLMLSGHPQIFMPENKEPRYFATDLRSRFESRAPAAERLLTLDGYLALFAPARSDQMAGEASPQYLRSHAAPLAIADMQPDARIIALFREPASFLRSFHLQMVSSHVESERDFRGAMALEGARREGKRIPRRSHLPQSLLYSDHVQYAEQLRRFHAVFPPEQVLVLIYEDFRRDNEGTLRQVLRFLDVDETHPIDQVETRPLKEVRSLRLHQMRRALRVAARNPAAAGPLPRAVNALARRQLRSGVLSAAFRRATYSTPRLPDEEFMLELRRRFRPEVAALSDYLGRDLARLWGYDDID